MGRWRSCCSVEAVWLLLLGGGLLIAVLTFWPPYWPWEVWAAQNHIRTELPLAAERWARNGTQDYDVDYYAFSHSGLCYAINREREDSFVTLQVRGGELVLTEESQRIDDNCSVMGDLPPQIFEQLERWVEDPRWQDENILLEVEFDPTYGFVSRYIWYRYDGGPGFTFRVKNFRPVLPTTPPPP